MQIGGFGDHPSESARGLERNPADVTASNAWTRHPGTPNTSQVRPSMLRWLSVSVGVGIELIFHDRATSDGK